MSGTVLLISFLPCSLLVNRKKNTDFSMMSFFFFFYTVSLLKVLVRSQSFMEKSLEFVKNKTVLSAARDGSSSPFFFYFFHLLWFRNQYTVGEIGLVLPCSY